MASRLSIILYTGNGALFVFIGVTKLLAGLSNWPHTLMWCVLSGLWFVQSARLARIPVLVIGQDQIQILPAPALEVRNLPLSLIVGIGKGWLGKHLLLVDGKKLSLPLSLLSPGDRRKAQNRLLALGISAP